MVSKSTKINSLVLILFLAYLKSYSQDTCTITQILQKTIQQENEARQMVYTEVDTMGNQIGLLQMDIDTLEVTEPFVIKKDTLYYTTKHILEFEKGYYTDQQIVALKDITAVTKDIGIFFETAPDKVKLIRREYFEESNSIKTSRNTDLFRTHFIVIRDNEYLADDLVKAFKKAGYKIEKGYWYD